MSGGPGSRGQPRCPSRTTLHATRRGSARRVKGSRIAGTFAGHQCTAVAGAAGRPPVPGRTSMPPRDRRAPARDSDQLRPHRRACIPRAPAGAARRPAPAPPQSRVRPGSSAPASPYCNLTRAWYGRGENRTSRQPSAVWTRQRKCSPASFAGAVAGPAEDGAPPELSGCLLLGVLQNGREAPSCCSCSTSGSTLARSRPADDRRRDSRQHLGVD